MIAPFGALVEPIVSSQRGALARLVRLPWAEGEEIHPAACFAGVGSRPR